MNAPRPNLRALADDPSTTEVARAPIRSRDAARPSAVATRLYHVSWLSPAGVPQYDSVRAPAHPVLEAACANIARGGVVTTEDGPRPIEDLEPGDKIVTSEYGPVTLRWVGTYDLSAHELAGGANASLIRVMADTFGLSKPSADMVLSPGSHILSRHASCQTLFGMECAYAPIRAYEDGMQVIGLTPRAPVTFYNLAFDRQATVMVNGIEVETFHPGPFRDALSDTELTYALLRLFPHITTPSDFGAQLTPRLTVSETQQLRAGG
jgi:hypothetical protein